jgi:hypothetical protein
MRKKERKGKNIDERGGGDRQNEETERVRE